MANSSHVEMVADFYDTHPINEQQILDKLAQDGIALDGLTEDLLQAYDQDHFGGPPANDVLARETGVGANSHVLDVCSGMGGPARYLAHNYGCRVTGIDLTQSRVAGAAKLTGMVGLSGRVEFHNANAHENPFADETFDVVIGQEAFCHIPDKVRLIAECVRVLKRGGRIGFSDILAREAMTDGARVRMARDMAQFDLPTLDDYRRLLEGAGCIVEVAEDLTAAWTTILVDRLAMYRGLKDQTVARFGAEHFARWDDAYSFFVGLYRTGELGGGRLVGRRELPTG